MLFCIWAHGYMVNEQSFATPRCLMFDTCATTIVWRIACIYNIGWIYWGVVVTVTAPIRFFVGTPPSRNWFSPFKSFQNYFRWHTSHNTPGFSVIPAYLQNNDPKQSECRYMIQHVRSLAGPWIGNALYPTKSCYIRSVYSNMVPNISKPSSDIQQCSGSPHGVHIGQSNLQMTKIVVFWGMVGSRLEMVVHA